MGATLDETRVELEAQRARVRGTADNLETATRRSLDIRAIVGRHPVRTVGLVAGAAFFLLGGPHRTVRVVRRALGAGADGERAYAALPPSLQAFIDHTAPGLGESKTEAKGKMALALHAWREDPKNRKKADRLVSETMTPPGPDRAFWALVELTAVVAAGIIGRRVVARRLMEGVLRAPSTAAGGAPSPAPSPEVGTAPRTLGPGPSTSKSAPAKSSSVRPTGPNAATGYSGWSGRQRSPSKATVPADEKPADATSPDRG